jgi:hypothetical protein
MFAPGPKLAACLYVLYRATIEARLLGWKGEREGLTHDECRKLGDLMDAVHNIPGLAADWERCDEGLLRAMLADYDARHSDALLPEYDRILAEYSRS